MNINVWSIEPQKTMNETLKPVNMTQPTITKSLSDTLGKNFNNEYDILPDVYEEMENIKSEAIKNWNFMKWPNWKDTNLPEKQRLLVRTKWFKTWFGDWENDKENSSKVIDENWEPLVVYHNTFKNKKFDTFDISKSKSGRGFYFTLNKVGKVQNFLLYSKDMPVFLNIKNPFIIDKKSWINWWATTDSKYFDNYIGQDNDGVIGMTNYLYDNGQLRSWYLPNRWYKNKSIELVVFNPNQIKSIDNYWSFSSSNSSIKY